MLLASACSHAPANTTPQPTASTLDKVWLLETSGAAVHDTNVSFDARLGRTIVMHHAAPDDAIFLVLQVPPAKDSITPKDSVHLSIHPMPGKYAFTLTTSDKLAAGTRASFSYALHFKTPSDAATKYPSAGRFEQLLVPATITADNKVQMLTAERPAADMLRFAVAGSGNYALVAVR